MYLSATAMITAYGRTDRWEDALNVLDDLLEADEDLLADEGVEGRDGDSSVGFLVGHACGSAQG